MEITYDEKDLLKDTLIKWEEDWNNSAVTETIQISKGKISHQSYREDNYTARSDSVTEKWKTLCVFDRILEYIDKYKKAKQIIKSLISKM